MNYFLRCVTDIGVFWLHPLRMTPDELTFQLPSFEGELTVESLQLNRYLGGKAIPIEDPVPMPLENLDYDLGDPPCFTRFVLGCDL